VLAAQNSLKRMEGRVFFFCLFDKKIVLEKIVFDKIVFEKLFFVLL
jgi:hypothetical protein